MASSTRIDGGRGARSSEKRPCVPRCSPRTAGRDRSMSACCSRTCRSSCSCCWARAWPARPSSASSTCRGAELARDINHTDCQLIVTDGTLAPLLDGITLDVPPERIFDIDGPAWAAACATAAQAVARGEFDATAAPDPETLFALLFTSGSTGAPKAVRMTQGRAVCAVANQMFTSSDVLYCAMPLYHGNALKREPLRRAAFGRDDRVCGASSPHRHSCRTCSVTV